MKVRQPIHFALWCMAVFLGLSLTGCGAGKLPVNPETPPQTAADIDRGTENTPVNHPTDAAALPEDSRTPDDGPSDAASANGPDSVAVGAKQEPAPSTPPVETASNKPADEKPDPENRAGPQTNALMGLRIGDGKQTVTRKYGQPIDEYSMDDGDADLLVCDYAGFSVGFDARGRVEFVTVHSAAVDPGLNGLKIGSSVKEVRATLGEPDTNTSFVLTYKSAGTIMKLDVDRKKEAVHSIKLFRANA